MKVALLSAVLLAHSWCAEVLQAQPLDQELAQVRTAFGSGYRFEVDRQHRLVIDLLKDGRPVRQDLVYLEFLDTAGVRWNEEEQAVELTCLDAHGQCIDKEIYHLGTVRHTGRSTLPLGDDRSAADAVEGLRALLVAGQRSLREQGLETHRRPSRKR